MKPRPSLIRGRGFRIFIRMKNRILIAFVICISVFEMHGQNLVLNGDFEDSIRCTNDTSFVMPRFWYSPTNGTPDYYYTNKQFHADCSTSGSTYGIWIGGDTINSFGSQTPHSRNAYAGFVISYGQEYMAVPLADSLRAGKKYCVEAYVSLAENSYAAMDLIGFCFTHDSVLRYDTSGVVNYFLDSAHGATADVENPPGTFITDSTGWVLISDTMIAQGGERYLTIGNFDSLGTQYLWLDSN